ncbi:MAG TPA: aldo/keto reductase [Aggregatilineales bacterium]|nr:aldo/keto reductase [Aggregatilineales bacterium]
MSRIILGENGLEFSRLAAGLWRLNEWKMSSRDLLNWIDACLDTGITTFDHADIYGGYTCETLFGNALALNAALRDDIEIVTKCGIKLVSERRPEHSVKSYDTSRQHIIQSVENSLEALQTDYIDLLLIHRPDPMMNADEIAEAFTQLWEDGKVLYFGVSNFTNTQFSLIDSRLSEFDLVTNQIEFSVMHTAPLYDGTLDWCQMLGIPPMIWSPLGGGRLFDDSEQARRVRAALQQVGDELGASFDQVALAWIMMHPARPIPVTGTGKIERIRAAVAAENLDMTREQWFAILEASEGHPVP